MPVRARLRGRNKKDVGGGERAQHAQKALNHKAQSKHEGIPTWGYPWGYPKMFKDRSLPGGVVFEKLLNGGEN
jgi:hypothetical protein